MLFYSFACKFQNIFSCFFIPLTNRNIHPRTIRESRNPSFLVRRNYSSNCNFHFNKNKGIVWLSCKPTREYDDIIWNARTHPDCIIFLFLQNRRGPRFVRNVRENIKSKIPFEPYNKPFALYIFAWYSVKSFFEACNVLFTKSFQSCHFYKFKK